jgi:hypothetical protein
MKRSFLTLLLTAFCFTAFTMVVPQQDTSKMKQHHAKKMGKAGYGKKTRTWKKSTSTSRDTMSRKSGKMDSTVKP